ncbi:bifunctional folylpolyglutamate synthase/dihydrofolate synthase [Aquibacillus salsiterrae]|uniref:tetrahydrofolate synthase n=1 Tax=Aquibacillus salsiterrae TaxID=2950439 RepID=A0A9X4ADP3_9BACI|nr:folylpolyglutamate synthase/dihydrofolate synthase family protein [Aquibacillus salsiterrae]MDC3415676.1 bifunctional folylpolyglutamate synthase/dihydrofolate synthase [Aquibacillus salsiterrae]
MMTIKTVEDVLNFFNSRRSLGIKPGLSRMEAMLKALGNPEKRIKAVHLAGTNGKGSTLAFMKQSLIESGYKVGSFTSPHIDLLDHIKVNDETINQASVVSLTNQLIPIVELLDQSGDTPTEFEILVVLAISFMAQEKVDIGLFEAGMGGREDSTNCINPILTIITTIGLDHTTFLGESIKAIAYHKAGIIKKNVPVIIGEIGALAFEEINKEATLKDAPLLRYSVDFTVKEANPDQFTFSTQNVSLPLAISLKGSHQVHNAALACMGLLQLRKLGFKVEDESVKQGMKHTLNPGRFEIMNRKPVVVLDGAHNMEGIESFICTINKYYPLQKKKIVFAAFKDKPIEKMVGRLEEEFDNVILTTFDHPRAATVEELISFSKRYDTQSSKDWKELLNSLLIDNDDVVLCLTGSLYFIELTRSYLINH